MVVQTSKDSHPRKVIPKEEDLTQEIEVESEVERLPLDVIIVTSWDSRSFECPKNE